MNHSPAFATLATLALCALVTPTVAQDNIAKANFVTADGKQAGTALLTQTPNGVLIQVDLRGLSAGEHGFHIHETGKCDAANGFKSAGGHFAPEGHKHGFEAKGGPHAGDMPNIFVPASGMLKAHVFNARVTLDGGKNSLFDNDGSALVIHAKADDYGSQPSGDAGDRLACAVIQR